MKDNQSTKINPEQEQKLADWSLQKFKENMLAKEPYASRWMTYLNAYNNSLYENQSMPSYKSNQISNFIFSTIESMRPIMFDGDPQFEAVPMNEVGMEFAGEINQLLTYEWHRTKMQQHMIANSIYTLVTGTSIMMLGYEWDSHPEGNVKPIKVNPFNLFPDPLATSVEDAENLIYATYKHVNQLKQMFPDKAERLIGGDITYPELVNYRNEGSRISNQVLVLEVYCRDYTTIEFEEEDQEGKKVKKQKKAYPNGRRIITAPELGIVFVDENMIFESGRFPFFITKDIDVPFQFWGEGEVKYLLSPQQYINDLSNQIIDNAKHTANMQWIIDKNAGIPAGQLTNRPGLIIRKNPGSEVRRDSPPSMPMYVAETIRTLKSDLEIISGIHDITRGQKPSGIESGTAIMALQEAGQTRIRLKITLLESSIGDMGKEWLARIRQFWKTNRQIPKRIGTNDLGQPQYSFLDISPNKQLKEDYDVIVIGSSMSNINKSSMFDLMIRLAQTTAEDGLPMVDRETVLDYLPKVNKDRILSLFAKKQQQQQIQKGHLEMLEQLAIQMQSMNGDLGSIQERLNAEDMQKQQEELMAKGYDQGIQERMALDMLANTEESPAEQMLTPELLAMIDEMDDEELLAFIAENPELEQLI